MKKYFLKDTSLKNIDEDQFRYQDFSNNLRRMIECNKAPFNIAIVGKWGLGKSSLINMALESLKGKNEYLICDINVWKYEKDEIGKAFIKELYENVNSKKMLSFNFFHKEYDEIVKNNITNKENKKIDHNWMSFFKFICLSLAVSALFFAIYCKTSNFFYGVEFTKCEFVISTFLRYCKNIGSILIIPLVVWMGKLFMDKLNKPSSNNYEITFPLETQSDYEIYLQDLLRKKFPENSNKKIIVVVDDLDRLSAAKIVEALDALKIFMEYDKFIFIVPFDDEILKNALDNNKLNSISDSNSEYDGEMVLDKLFQYKIYLPQLIKSDMRKYVFSICREDCKDFIKEYFGSDEELFKEIAGKILVHSNVTTPRQAKKIVNTFVANVMIARDRERAKKVSKDFASKKKGLETIAKISVLQSDYNEFYDALFEDVNAIDDILRVHRKEINILQSQVLGRFFDKKQDCYELKKEYESLLNFLSFTENLGESNITPYLYMAETEAGVIVGDKKRQDFIAAVESCNFVTSKQFLIESPILLEVMLEQLKYDETATMGNMVVSGIECWDTIEEKYRFDFAKAINDRIKSIISSKITFRYDLINVTKLVDMCKCINTGQYNSLIEYVFELCEGEQEIRKLILKVAKVKNDLSESVKVIFENTVKEWILSDESGVRDIIDFVNEEKIEYVANIYGKVYIERIIKHITENDDVKKDIIIQLGDVIKHYLENNSITEIEEILVPCFEYPSMHEMLNESIDSSIFAEINNSKVVADTIVGIGTDKLKDVCSYEILANLTYTIDEKDKGMYDEFFLSIIENQIFADVVLGFSRGNSLQMIPNTVKKLTEYSFDNDMYASDARILVNKFSESQSQQFWSIMKTKSAYSSNRDYNVLVNLITELCEEEVYIEKLVYVVTEVIIPGLCNYYNQDNYRRNMCQVVTELKEYINQDDIDEFSEILLKAISLDTNAVLNTYRNIHLYISKEYWCNNITVVLKVVSKGTYSIIYDIVTSRFEFFNDENNNMEQLLSFLVEYIEMSDNPKDIISIISDKFSSISNVDIIINKVIDLGIDEQWCGSKLSKFIDDLDIHSIIQIVDDAGDERRKLSNILSTTKKYSPSNIIVEVNKYKDEISKSDLMSTLSFCEAEVNRDNVRDVVEIGLYMVENYFEKDVCIKILQVVAVIPTPLEDGVKQSLSILLSAIFTSSSSDDVKKKCAILIKDKKITTKIRSMLTKEQILEYKSYI